VMRSSKAGFGTTVPPMAVPAERERPLPNVESDAITSLCV